MALATGMALSMALPLSLALPLAMVLALALALALAIAMALPLLLALARAMALLLALAMALARAMATAMAMLLAMALAMAMAMALALAKAMTTATAKGKKGDFTVELPKEFRFITKPYEYQERVVRDTWHKLFHGLFLDMGLGKTKISIDTGQALACNNDIDAVLVVAPKGMYHQWSEQISLHMGGCSLPFVVCTWNNKQTNKVNEMLSGFEAFYASNYEALPWLVVNIEALRSTKNKKSRAFTFTEKFLKKRRALMVIDESTTIKNHKSAQTKAALKLGALACAKRILSGTPCPQSPLDLFSQMFFLDKSIFGRSYYAFRARFAELKDQYVAGGRVVKVVSGFKRTDELQKIVSANATRLTKKECLDLPPKVYSMFEVEMTTEQKKHYNQMKKWCHVDLKGKIVTAPLAISRLMKLRQILSGFVIDEEGSSLPLPHNRCKALLEILSFSEEKTLVWCSFIHSIKEISRLLQQEYGKGSFITYTGVDDGIPREEKQRMFQKDGNCRFFLGTPTTGKFGLNLTSGSRVVYYDNSFDLDVRLQSEDRCHRIGQENKVTYIDLVVPGTIDEKIRRCLIAKKKIQDELVDGGWVEWLS